MSWLARAVFLWIVAISAVAQSKSELNSSPVDREHTTWVADAIKAIETVKVGTTRSDLMKVLTTEGGLSTASQRTYVYLRCPYIKVDVKFAASSGDKELPTDKIVEVSRPYLAWSIFD